MEIDVKIAISSLFWARQKHTETEKSRFDLQTNQMAFIAQQ
jgi:hypothetical protein